MQIGSEQYQCETHTSNGPCPDSTNSDKDIDGACVEQIVDRMVRVVRLIELSTRGVPRCNADLAVKGHVLGRRRHGAVDMVDCVAHALTVGTA